MEARILGSGGWMPTDARETTCIYVREGDHVLVVDAGTGLRRLAAESELTAGVRKVSVVLTHFHIDHIMGLPFLHDVDVPEREIWGGGAVLEGVATEELLHRLLDPPFMPDWGLPGEIRELAPPGAEIGPFRLDVRIQPLHHNPTLGVKVNGELVVCTDTASDVANATFAAGARVLCHDAFTAADKTDEIGHSAAGEVARIAAAARVERLILIHVNPTLRDDEELLRFARPVFPDVAVAHDGMIL